MIKLTVLLISISLLLLSGCSGTPAKRDTAYWAAVTGTVADGFSTSYALSNNPCAYESGFAASRLIGKRPSNGQIAGQTAARIGLLEWSRYWKPVYHKTYKWATVAVTLYVVPNNYKVGDMECGR